MSLVNIKTFDEGGVVRHTRDEKIVIDTVKKHIIIICVDSTVTPIDAYEKAFTMEISNNFLLPVVDMEMNPVWENPQEVDPLKRIQKKIGEYNAFEFYNDHKIASIKESLSAAILRVKGLNPNPNVFIQF